MVMDREKLTAGAFAESIGVAQATISHILGPRNKYPSTEVILRLHQRYNDINLEWLLTVTPDEYVQLRDAYFMGNGYIRWDRDAIAYVLLENDYADGYAYKVQHHGREELLLFREEENAIEVLETTLSEQDLLAVLKRLRIKVLVRVRKSLAAVEREERVGNDKKESGYQKKDFGMITGCDEAENGYLNLTLE